jgi:hypothetical protein
MKYIPSRNARRNEYIQYWFASFLFAGVFGVSSLGGIELHLVFQYTNRLISETLLHIGRKSIKTMNKSSILIVHHW